MRAGGQWLLVQTHVAIGIGFDNGEEIVAEIDKVPRQRGYAVRQVKMPDVYPTNICFGGADRRTAYITLSDKGQLGAMQWPTPGLKLNF